MCKAIEELAEDGAGGYVPTGRAYRQHGPSLKNSLMGKVYRYEVLDPPRGFVVGGPPVGQYVPTQQYVAIKTYWKDCVARGVNVHGEDCTERPLEENAFLQRLAPHPNVVRLLAFMEEIDDPAGQLFAVLEFLDQGDLMDRMLANGGGEARPFDEARARRYFRQVAEGLRHCHARGIVHLDVGFENTMIHLDVCRLIDFGAAQDWAPGRTVQVWRGKTNYAAPEMYLREGPNGCGPITPYDPSRADIWSLGCMLFIMTAGVPLVGRRGATVLDPVFKFVLEGGAGGLSRLMASWGMTDGSGAQRVALSPGLRDLLVLILRPDPAERPSLDEILQHPWAAG